MLTSSQLSALVITYSLPSCCLQERKWWHALSALLAGQPLFSLSLCPGLVPALAEAGQYALIPLVAAQVRSSVLMHLLFGVPPGFCLVLLILSSDTAVTPDASAFRGASWLLSGSVDLELTYSSHSRCICFWGASWPLSIVFTCCRGAAASCDASAVGPPPCLCETVLHHEEILASMPVVPQPGSRQQVCRNQDAASGDAHMFGGPGGHVLESRPFAAALCSLRSWQSNMFGASAGHALAMRRMVLLPAASTHRKLWWPALPELRLGCCQSASSPAMTACCAGGCRTSPLWQPPITPSFPDMM